jgi:hypothetical protein
MHEQPDALHGLARDRELELVRQMLEQERSERARERTMHERERETWESERSFLRTMLEKHTDQIKLLTDQRERAIEHRGSWFARWFMRKGARPSPSAP